MSIINYNYGDQFSVKYEAGKATITNKDGKEVSAVSNTSLLSTDCNLEEKYQKLNTLLNKFTSDRSFTSDDYINLKNILKKYFDITPTESMMIGGNKQTKISFEYTDENGNNVKVELNINEYTSYMDNNYFQAEMDKYISSFLEKKDANELLTNIVNCKKSLKELGYNEVDIETEMKDSTYKSITVKDKTTGKTWVINCDFNKNAEIYEKDDIISEYKYINEDNFSKYFDAVVSENGEAKNCVLKQEYAADYHNSIDNFYKHEFCQNEIEDIIQNLFDKKISIRDFG